MLKAIIVILVDESVFAGSDKFLEVDDERSKARICKPGKCLEELSSIINGAEVYLHLGGMVKMTRTKNYENFLKLRTKAGFRSHSALGKYITVSCRLDVCATVQLSAPRSMSV